MKSYQTILFDLDGTLLDTIEDLTDAVNYTMRTLQACTWTVPDVLSFVGNGYEALLAHCLPSGKDDPRFSQALITFSNYYGTHCNIKTKPYPGILELLSMLKSRGAKMAIVSNKGQAAVQALCDLYFSQYMDLAVGARPNMPKKPAPPMVELAIHSLNASPETTLYVGDSEVDVHTALNAGVDGAAVLWGFRTREVLLSHGAKKLFPTADALGDYILGK